MSALILIIYMVVLVFTIWGIVFIAEDPDSSCSFIILPMLTLGVAVILLCSVYGIYYIAQQFRLP